VTSAFIIQVHSQLQLDPNEETAALLRVLIHKIDNTTFGGDVPALPQWTGPPQTAIQVQCILYASLSASLLSAFLAMLGKQWLNRYASIDMRGSTIERSQNRQRKLDGIVTWYFDHVLESLPLMLQGALLLLGCALSRYLWDIDTVVASVVLGVTSFGLLFYLFVVVAGVTSDSCPYQTPGANVIRRIPDLVRSTYTLFIECLRRTLLHSVTVSCWDDVLGDTVLDTIAAILLYPLLLPFIFAIDVFRIGRAIFRILVDLARRACSWLFGTSPNPDQAFDNRATKLDFRCIVWMLQTSLDKTVNLSTLDYLGSILPLSGLSPSTASTVLADCFNTLGSCFVTNHVTTVTRGSEQLAGVSAMCFFRLYYCLLSTDSTSPVFRDVRQRYKRVFPSRVNLRGLPCPTIMTVIHILFGADWRRPLIDWRCYDPPTDELVPFSCALAQVAQFQYAGGEPEWLVAFALRFLSQDPLPPTSVVVNCLSIIAADLGCNVFDTNSMALDERCGYTSKASVPLLTIHQRTA